MIYYNYIIIMNYRYVHNQLVERREKSRKSHVKSMVTDDDESTHPVRLFSLSQAASIVA